MEPVYEQYPVKLNEGKTFNDFIANIPVMGYVSSRTKVLKVVEKIGKEKREVDPSVFEAAVRAKFAKPVEESKIDYKAESEKQKKINDDLLKRLEALESKNSDDELLKSQDGELKNETEEKGETEESTAEKVNEPTEKEIRKALFDKARELGRNPAKNITTDELRKLIE